ncbi:hypothetical protein ACTMSW_02395 [Micromonospora sp. BQ11]|uniref:hypothetical protein n=1 Tax=Micromonospora sp. BQ11 TaxID=3452212 RepID=UPI003F8B4977
MGERLDVDPSGADPQILAALQEYAGPGGSVRLVTTFRHAPHHTEAVLLCVAVTRPARKWSHNTTQKLFVKALSRESATRESSGHQRARSSNLDFAAVHIVEQVDTWHPVGDGRFLLFQRVANGGDRVAPLTELSDDERPAALRSITAGLLDGWNGTDGAGVPTASATVGAFVEREVVAMASVTEVRAAARELGAPDGNHQWIVIDGRVRSNPLHLLTGDSFLAREPVVHIVGHTHGDLHGGNILIPYEKGRPQPAKFLLVDPGGYEAGAPLTRDLDFLLVTLLLGAVAPSDPSDRDRALPRDQAEVLRHYLIDPDVPRPGKLLHPLAELIEVVDEAGRNYARAGDFGPEWRAQRLLSLVSHALICLTFDSIGGAGREWCWRLAVEALEAYRAGLAGASSDALKAALSPPPATDLPVFHTRGTGAGQRDSKPSDHWIDQRRWGQRASEPVWSHDSLLHPPLLAAGEGAREMTAPVGLTGGEAHQALPSWPVGNAPALAASPPVGMMAGGSSRARTDRWKPFSTSPLPVPQQRRSQDLPDPPDPPRRVRRWARVRIWLATVAGLLAVGGAGGLAATLVDRRSEQDAAPERTLDPTPGRGFSSAPGRPPGGRKGPPPADRRLDDLARDVAALREPRPQGRYAFTCFQVWSLNTTPGGDERTSHHEYRLWFTPRLSGVRVTTDLDGAEPTRTTRSSYQAGDLTDVTPLPADEPDELRDQVAQEWTEQPAELQDATGMLRLVARFHHFHPLVPAQRAALIQELAGTAGIVYLGAYADRTDRPGLAFQAEDREGRRDTLLFDHGGRLLSHELTDADGAILSTHLYLRSTRTDATDTRCS